MRFYNNIRSCKTKLMNKFESCVKQCKLVEINLIFKKENVYL